ncbi:hypothetical protein [Chamaesiphon sp.]|uniref:hypothetical protein n=1 Tax=Chamaesiphon sp. TaxID=2814140 RepID=UPI0035932274
MKNLESYINSAPLNFTYSLCTQEIDIHHPIFTIHHPRDRFQVEKDDRGFT